MNAFANECRLKLTVPSMSPRQPPTFNPVQHVTCVRVQFRGGRDPARAHPGVRAHAVARVPRERVPEAGRD